MNTATAIIESILEKPEDWTVTEHTINHKNGVKIWAANTWTNRRVYEVGGKSTNSAEICFSDGDKQLLDNAILVLKEDRIKSSNLEAEVLARLAGKHSWLSEDTKWVLFIILAITVIFVMGMAFGATIGISMAKQSQAEVAPVSSQTN